jgi:hypothetical protein
LQEIVTANENGLVSIGELQEARAQIGPETDEGKDQATILN